MRHATAAFLRHSHAGVCVFAVHAVGPGLIGKSVGDVVQLRLQDAVRPEGEVELVEGGHVHAWQLLA